MNLAEILAIVLSLIAAGNGGTLPPDVADVDSTPSAVVLPAPEELITYVPELPAPPPITYEEEADPNGGPETIVELEEGGPVPFASDGWVTSPYTGALVCVTGAPCERDPEFTGPEVSSYNWLTGEVN